MLEGGRRLDRERVLTLLYEVEMKAQSAEEVLKALPVEPDAFVVETVTGVDDNADAIDQLVDTKTQKWDVERLASVDRNILRIGVWELQNRPELSVAIIINEALELAKRFSTDESSKFVNGILSAIADQVRS